jgi:predicted nucleotide-binding protein (sugar kinase/HSP70/actin superfamily)
VLRRAACAFAAVKSDRQVPSVLVVGEIYVRCDPFSNDFVIEKLEQRGIRARFAPVNEWLEYTDYISRRQGQKTGLGAQLSAFVQSRLQDRVYGIVAQELRWPKRTTVRESLAAAAPYLRQDLCGEAVLTLGGPLHEWQHGLIDGTLSVGPLECMPNKISEAQFFHVAEREGLASLTLSLNGDPVDPELLDNFAFEVHNRFARRRHRFVFKRKPGLRRRISAALPFRE